ncbi:GM16136 [Drosophila sechellia]|uniref:Lysosome-associated membrane glycoprotein 5 n=1 Tax=Drosophila sechellia TaxID=7238 RepID=B4IIF7_DROSE|nr:GM16136 [Drosophila sechellia]
MFANKLLTCSALLIMLLLLSNTVFSQKLISLPRVGINVSDFFLEQANSLTSSPSTSSTTTEKPITTRSTSTITPTRSTTPSTESPTTTAPVISTTPAPQTYPQPSVGAWNTSCIMLQMAAQLNFTYEAREGNFTTGLYNIPSNASVEDAECESHTTQFIHLIWGPETSKQSLLMYFDKINDTTVLSSIQIHLTLLSEDFPDAKEGNFTTGLYNIPSNASVEDAECESHTTQFIHLIWGPETSKQSLLMYFDKINDTTVLSSIQIHLTLLSEDFPDAKENQTVQLITRSSGEFKTPDKMSYHCTRVQKMNMTETLDAEPLIGWISVRHVQVEAFRRANDTGFSVGHDCDSSETSDVVPIAVGIALAALILVVLVSYLCARRRSTSRGYMSF